MNEDHPQIFYKYTTIETAEIILKTTKLRWSSPSIFNDLNEYRRMPIFSPALEEDWDVYIRRVCEHAYGLRHENISHYSGITQRLISLVTLIKQQTETIDELYNLIHKECHGNQDDMTNMLREFTEALNIQQFRRKGQSFDICIRRKRKDQRADRMALT